MRARAADRGPLSVCYDDAMVVRMSTAHARLAKRTRMARRHPAIESFSRAGEPRTLGRRRDLRQAVSQRRERAPAGPQRSSTRLRGSRPNDVRAIMVRLLGGSNARSSTCPRGPPELLRTSPRLFAQDVARAPLAGMEVASAPAILEIAGGSSAEVRSKRGISSPSYATFSRA